MKQNSKIYVAGHTGLVGSAIVRALRAQGYNNLILKTHTELDLLNQQAVADFFTATKPEYVFLAAAKVGGILANNTYPAEFIYQNLQIEINIIHQAYLHQVKKLLFLGSSCIYPKFAKQPITEDALLGGYLEPTNEPYAVAKIAGIKMCQSYNRQYQTNFISVMPTNLYGTGDNFDLNSSHVLPALIRKFNDAKKAKQKEVTLWGTGKVKREFLFVDDLARACVFLMNNYNGSEIINIGISEDLSIKKLANLVKKIVGFKGKIAWDATKPDGTPRKILNVDKLHNLGWRHQVNLEDGISATYNWYLQNQNTKA